MKKLYYLTNDRESQDGSFSIREKFDRAGANTGNLVFQKAILNQLSGAELIGTGDLSSVERGSDFVICLANFIRPGTGFLKDWASALQNAGANSVTLVGVGAQQKDYDANISLDSGTKYFLDFVSANSSSIGVRGEYTANILSSFGIQNVDIIGCPSLFLHKDRNFILNNRPMPDRPRIAIASTPDVSFTSNIRDLLLFGYIHEADYIVQSESWITAEQQEGADADFGFYYNYSLNDNFIETLHKWFLRRAKTFFSFADWERYLTSIDFFVGARFHGAAMSIINGVPALPLAFDTRTRELCEYFRIPFMLMGDFSLAYRMEDLWCKADYTDFNTIYKVRYDQYANFLRKNGLRNSLEHVGSAHIAGDYEKHVKSSAPGYFNRSNHVMIPDSYSGNESIFREVQALRREIVNMRRDLAIKLESIKSNR